MQEANRNTELLSLAEQILKETETRGEDTLDILGKTRRFARIDSFVRRLLGNSSAKISGTIEKYILNEHLISKSKDSIDQYERKAKYEKLIIITLLVVYFAIALNIVKERLLWWDERKYQLSTAQIHSTKK